MGQIPTSSFDTADTLYMALGTILLKPVGTSLSGVTAAIGSTFTSPSAHGLKVGQQIRYVSGTGGTGLTAGSDFWVLAVPTATTFTLTATRKGTVAAAVTAALSAGVFQPIIVLDFQKLKLKAGEEEKTYERADSKGVVYELRSARRKATSGFGAEMDDIKRLPLIFNGGLSGRVVALGSVWIPDTDDAPGKCSLVSEADFPCVLTRTDDIDLGGGEYGKAQLSIKVTKLGDLLWTPDATL